jgi:hypothetical protein
MRLVTGPCGGMVISPRAGMDQTSKIEGTSVPENQVEISLGLVA